MPDIGYLPAIQSETALRRGWIARRAVLVGAIVAGATLAALTTPAGEVAIKELRSRHRQPRLRTTRSRELPLACLDRYIYVNVSIFIV